MRQYVVVETQWHLASVDQVKVILPDMFKAFHYLQDLLAHHGIREIMRADSMQCFHRDETDIHAFTLPFIGEKFGFSFVIT